MATTTARWIIEARRRLLDLRLGPGAWGYRPGTLAATEPTALAALALLATQGEGDDDDDDESGPAAAREAAARLASIRRRDGSLGVTSALPEPGWPTPLGLLLWAAVGGFEADRAAAVHWLLATRGKPSSRVPDDPFGHDVTLVGWPWALGTHSWVEPTSMALLALGREGSGGHPRAREGVRVLLDRAIPGGGWNLGNPVVFGTTLRPLPGPTGLALLALAKVAGPSPSIGPATAYLKKALLGTLAPVSIGWGMLGLRAWGDRVDLFKNRLDEAAMRVLGRGGTPIELAFLMLAAGGRSLDVLGVAPRDEEAHHA